MLIFLVKKNHKIILTIFRFENGESPALQSVKKKCVDTFFLCLYFDPNLNFQQKKRKFDLVKIGPPGT